jgi:hypothetical protein
MSSPPAEVVHLDGVDDAQLNIESGKDAEESGEMDEEDELSAN